MKKIFFLLLLSFILFLSGCITKVPIQGSNNATDPMLIQNCQDKQNSCNDLCSSVYQNQADQQGCSAKCAANYYNCIST